MARYSEAVEPGTVWTWNAIGKAAGAWNLGVGANESQRGFLLNHLITDELPGVGKQDARLSNSDPITGQAAWYDVRVRVYPAEHDADHTLPQFAIHCLFCAVIAWFLFRPEVSRYTNRINLDQDKPPPLHR